MLRLGISLVIRRPDAPGAAQVKAAEPGRIGELICFRVKLVSGQDFFLKSCSKLGFVIR